MRHKLSFTEALLLLIGTQIGAGILGLPYIMKDSGLMGIAIVVLVGIITMITSLFILACIKEDEDTTLTDLASSRLGKWAGILTFLSIVLYGYGALIAYIASSGNILSTALRINPTIGALLFWAIMSGIVLMGLRASGKAEVLIGISLLVALGISIALVLPSVKAENLMTWDMKNLLPLIGVSMFAYASHLIVPEIKTGTDKETAKKVIIWGFFIPMVFYALFVLAFVGAFGKDVPQMAMMAISGKFGILGTLLGILVPLTAISTSFIGIAYAQMNNIKQLIGNKLLAWLLVVVPPIFIYLMGLRSFTGALSVAGSYGGLIFAGIIPVLLYIKASERTSYRHLAYSLLSLFALVFIANLMLQHVEGHRPSFFYNRYTI